MISAWKCLRNCTNHLSLLYHLLRITPSAAWVGLPNVQKIHYRIAITPLSISPPVVSKAKLEQKKSLYHRGSSDTTLLQDTTAGENKKRSFVNPIYS